MDNSELIKLLNDFLVGINMGSDTFKSYEEKLENQDLKNEFKKILSTFASQKEIVVSQINKLGGEVDESKKIYLNCFFNLLCNFSLSNNLINSCSISEKSK